MAYNNVIIILEMFIVGITRKFGYEYEWGNVKEIKYSIHFGAVNGCSIVM